MSTALQPPVDGDQYIGYKLEAVAVSTFVAAAIAVSLRLFSRAKYGRVGWDDAFMLLAIVGSEVVPIPTRSSVGVYRSWL